MLLLIQILFLSLVLPYSFETIHKLRTINFCTLLGEDCFGNKCNYYEKCPSPFVNKCEQNKCARNASECLIYSSTESYFNSRYLKTNAKLYLLPDRTVNALRKQEAKFRRFQNQIPICESPVYSLNSSDVCFLNKVLFLI